MRIDQWCHSLHARVRGGTSHRPLPTAALALRVATAPAASTQGAPRYSTAGTPRSTVVTCVLTSVPVSFGANQTARCPGPYTDAFGRRGGCGASGAARHAASRTNRPNRQRSAVGGQALHAAHAAHRQEPDAAPHDGAVHAAVQGGEARVLAWLCVLGRMGGANHRIYGGAVHAAVWPLVWGGACATAAPPTSVPTCDPHKGASYYLALCKQAALSPTIYRNS